MKQLINVDVIKPLAVVAVFAMSTSSLLARAEMDHSKMAQTKTDQPEIRDPHAYSDGYTLEKGPYALGGPRQIKLADEHKFWAIQGDRVEYDSDNDTGVFDVRGWYGSTYDRLYVKFEGDVASGRLEESQADILWSHAYSAYFDTQLGIRLDQYDEGVDRQWLAIGLQGLAPYWFELDMTAYIGESGRTALSLEAEYEILLSQQWVLQPRAEVSLYGQDDIENGLGDGFSDVAFGLRVRYEMTRQFAPYVGVEWTSKLGQTADIARAANESVRDTRYVAGIKFWF
ncbi:copper resistance protein B [Neptunomonas concharum]|uniref:Copper resistance protein B n=1 Tax=Neptunomonas concharum TaxID=1031538 RepID=A0A5P1RAY6_9GAMM|nr:copper resistance protein B [Neptunomonas concharum]QEQ96790.1 copper resistance protein B [Neptunomonas concharum]